MRYRKNVLAMIVMSGAMVIVLHGTWAEVAGQVSQRGYSSRGVNAIGSRSSMQRGRTTRPANNQSIYGGNANTGGPLNLGNMPALSGPTVYFDSSMPLNSTGDLSSQGNIGSQSGVPSAGSRPSIRPRLNIADQDAMNSTGVLRSIRDTVLEQIAQCAEKPFSPEWYAAHGSVLPVQTKGGNPWGSSSWTEVKEWVGLDAEPQRYDFRPDDRGLIFVYRDEVRRERAVDARGPAGQLANTSTPVDNEPPGLSLGVFAAVPPVDGPVQFLLHLIVSQSGTVLGCQYDFSADSMQPLRGALDRSSQRMAWQAGNVVTEAGLGNLTEDLARALVFRDDGWTQAWILMRIPESIALEPKQVQQ
jgi:hypothetical protein